MDSLFGLTSIRSLPMLKHLFLSTVLCCLTATAQRLRPTDVAAAQARIWANYQADARATGDTLPTLSPLTTLEASIERQLSWPLPQWLEAAAPLRFHYGSKGARPKEGYPLFLYLHGSGEPQREWHTGWKLAQLFDDGPSVYFVPMIPQAGAWYRWYQQSKQWAWERLFRQALASPLFDPTRLYLFGISEGGYGSQRLASFYADYLAGAGPMAAGEPLRNAPPDNCANIAFSLLTGEKDEAFHRNLLTRETAEAFAALQQLHPEHYKHRIELIPGQGHSIDYRSTTPWLAQHRRVAQPKWWRWESFPMHGRYREAFYNLRIDRWPRPAAPSAFQLDSLAHYDNTAPRRMHSLRIEGQTVFVDIDEVEYVVEQTSPRWHFPMTFAREYRFATEGSYTLFLSPAMIDLTRPIRLVVNERTIFRGRIPMSEETIAESLATFHDPLRLFPAAVRFSLSRPPL